MEAKKVKAQCDVLRDLISVGPGDNPEILRRALGIVRALRVAATWDYSRQILDDLRERLQAWFSDRQWRGDQAELRHVLLQHLEQVTLSWEEPVAGV